MNQETSNGEAGGGLGAAHSSAITVELLPRAREDESGKHKAKYYPHIFGNPIPAIAGCEHCKQFRGAEETCGGWALEPQNAPLFCGPVCPRFDLVDEKRELLEQVWPPDRDGGQQKGQSNEL